MKHITHSPAAITRLVAALTITIAALTTSTSCHKDPNIEENLPAEKYSLTALERRCQETEKTFDWTISPSGKTDSVEESIDEMYVTAVNELTLHSSTPVNVVSSNTKAVGVEKLSNTSFRLTYVDDGEASVQVWNGGKNFKKAANKTEFKVKAKKIVGASYAVFLYDGKPLKVPFRSQKAWDDYFEMFYGFRVADGDINITGDELPDKSDNPPKIIHHIEFVGIEPENASRRLAAFESRFTREILFQYREMYERYLHIAGTSLAPPMMEPWDDWCLKNGYDVSSWLIDETCDVADMHKEYYFGRANSGTYSELLCTITVGHEENKMIAGLTCAQYPRTVF